MRLNFLLIAAALGAIAVLLGALGAHALRPLLSGPGLESYETAVRYQFFHVLALAVLYLLDPKAKVRRLRLAGYLFIAGITLFCGSIYALSLQHLAGLSLGFLGPVTPVGGFSLMAGWIIMASHAASGKGIHVS